ncbi:cation diffusion facilitator family transporter [Paraclostridium bifermentans]|uniref:cation diffusion facilitator family transporter n=1 Tax=Paraclostridium bifermentans TaxID=1490 RepID=UPI003D29DADC
MFGADRRIKIAFLSVLSNTTLIFLKIVAGVLSGSVSIISEAIHSGMDLMASIVALLSVKHSVRPADRNHPFGHGKIENISGLFEGVLIFIAAGLIIKEAVKKIFTPAEIEQSYIAIAVMIISALVNFFVSKELYKVAKEEDSMALEADALHLKTDIYTSLGVAIGILLMQITGILMLDSIVAILVALLIIKEAWELSKNAFENLIDVRLSESEELEIKSIIKSHDNEFIDYHKLKTRKSGNIKHIDFHITVNPNCTVKEGHDIITRLKKDMNERLNNTRVTIHLDPYKEKEN